MCDVARLELNPCPRSEVLRKDFTPSLNQLSYTPLSLKEAASLFTEVRPSSVSITTKLAANSPDGLWGLMRDILADADRSTAYSPATIHIEDTPACRRWYVSHYAAIQSLLMRNPALRTMTVILRFLEDSFSKPDADWELFTSASHHLASVYQCLRAGNPLDALRVAEAAENWPLCCELDRAYMLSHSEAWYEGTAHVPLFGEYQRGDSGAEWVSNEHRLTHLASLFDLSNDESMDSGSKAIFSILTGNADVLAAHGNLFHWRDQLWAALRCCLVAVLSSEVSLVTGDMGWRGTSFHTYTGQQCPAGDTKYTMAISRAVEQARRITSEALFRSADDDEMWTIRVIQHSLCAVPLWSDANPSPLSGLICCSLDRAAREGLSSVSPQGEAHFHESVCALASAVFVQDTPKSPPDTHALCARLLDLVNDNHSHTQSVASTFTRLRSRGGQVDDEVNFLSACQSSLERRGVSQAQLISAIHQGSYSPRFASAEVDELFLHIATCSHATAPGVLTMANVVAVNLTCAGNVNDVAVVVGLVDSLVVSKHAVASHSEWGFWAKYAETALTNDQISNLGRALSVAQQGGRTMKAVEVAQSLRDAFDFMFTLCMETIKLGHPLAVANPKYWAAVFHVGKAFINCAHESLCAGSEASLPATNHRAQSLIASISRILPLQCSAESRAFLSSEAAALLDGHAALMREVYSRLHIAAARHQLRN